MGVIRRLSEIKVNDRVILPPFGASVGHEYHTSQRSVSRRVLSVARDGDVVVLVLDGHEPRTLPASLEVHVLF